MSRYFLEVKYKGTEYSGFQSQANANTIQAEVEKVFAILQRERVIMTGSSRTDAGVHALQNYFHFDYSGIIHPHFVYKMNSILPSDIVISTIFSVADNCHCRFDAVSRHYHYYVYQYKDPFLKDRAFYFPYKLDFKKMQEAATLIKDYQDFTSFSKRNTQAKTFVCEIMESDWLCKGNQLIYSVKANRFLRGMVRALVATMLQVGRNKLSIEDYKSIIQAKDCTKANFAAPAKGLFLDAVAYPENYF